MVLSGDYSVTNYKVDRAATTEKITETGKPSTFEAKTTLPLLKTF